MNTSQSLSAGSAKRPSARTVAFASFVGTAIEWYDFFLYGTAAALILGPLYFPSAESGLATLALYRGLAEGISQARSVRGYPEWFYVLGQGNVLGVPTQIREMSLAMTASV